MFILKVGGGRDINWDFIAQDLKQIWENVVIVHGANWKMREVSQKLGLEEKMITSPTGHISRYTDEKTIETLTMVYSGLVNKKIVSVLQKHEVNAIGLTGADGKLWLAKKKKAILSQEGEKVKVISDSKTGNVIRVNVSLIQLLLEAGYTPVVTIPAVTEEGELINVDNDRAVALMARDLKVKTVVMLFEAPGFLTCVDDACSRVPDIIAGDLDKYLNTIFGRMKKKLLGVKEALSFGVKTVYFGDGRIASPVSSALKGHGTVIKNV